MLNNKIDDVLDKLSKSKFRSSFKLKEKDKLYITSKGMTEVKKHTYEFIKKRLAPSIILNDGKQTPMKGHPTFIAQHATATCCRECLYKWHHIQKNRQLSPLEEEYVADVIMTWLEKEMK